MTGSINLRLSGFDWDQSALSGSSKTGEGDKAWKDLAVTLWL